MSDRKVFHDSITELPQQQGVTANGLIVNAAKPEARDQRMDVLFSLDIPSKDDLEKQVASGAMLLAEQARQEIFAEARRVEKLKKWLIGQGFKVTGQSPDGTSVYANATAGQIEQKS